MTESLRTTALAVGDIVRRGRGKTIWRIREIDDRFISLESVDDGWTKSSVTLDKADSLTRVTTDWGTKAQCSS